MPDLSTPPVTLRYFDCRGRAQALRYLLIDAGIEFDDDRVPFDERWATRRDDPAFSGPFGGLPVLRWGDLELAQTEAIALFLGRALGLAGDGGDQDAAWTVAFTAFGHQDLLQPALGVIWQPADGDDEAFASACAAARDRLRRRYGRLERWLASRGPYVLGESPCAGDYFVFEAIDVGRTLLGHNLLDEFPRVVTLLSELAARPRLALHLQTGDRPTRFSGSPTESQLLARLAAKVDREADAGA
ncbi:MAG: glutathione S-transferase family protein [Myxococcales bacterium]|nr:glutathione S-transferase family protein [Myxococcales bacterium]